MFSVIQNAGFRFPPREENVEQFFSSPQIQPVIEHLVSANDDLAAQASLQSDASGLRYSVNSVWTIFVTTQAHRYQILSSLGFPFRASSQGF